MEGKIQRLDKWSAICKPRATPFNQAWLPLPLFFVGPRPGVAAAADGPPLGLAMLMIHRRLGNQIFYAEELGWAFFDLNCLTNIRAISFAWYQGFRFMYSQGHRKLQQTHTCELSAGRGMGSLFAFLPLGQKGTNSCANI